MPGELGEDAGLDTEGGIGAAIEILRVERFAFGMLKEIVVAAPLNWSEVIDWLPPHHMFFSVVASRTVNLSFGERPVCVPVSALSAPSDVIVASPARSESS